MAWKASVMAAWAIYEPARRLLRVGAKLEVEERREQGWMRGWKYTFVRFYTVLVGASAVRWSVRSQKQACLCYANVASAVSGKDVFVSLAAEGAVEHPPPPHPDSRSFISLLRCR